MALRAILKEKVNTFLFVGLLSLKTIVLEKYLNVAADNSYIFGNLVYFVVTNWDCV